MDGERKRLTDELRQAGFSRTAIDAAWPSWWDEGLASSPSGRAELRFALARRVGLRPDLPRGATAWATWTSPITSTSSTRRQSSGSTFVNGNPKCPDPIAAAWTT